jgi:dTDP-glucose 4,6-dehydratase
LTIEHRTVVQLCDIVDALFAADPELTSRFPMAPAARGASSRTLIAHVPDRPGHDRRYALDCGQIERTLAFTRTTTLSAGMAMTARWYIDHEPWWRKAALSGARSGLPAVLCGVPCRDVAVS